MVFAELTTACRLASKPNDSLEVIRAPSIFSITRDVLLCIIDACKSVIGHFVSLRGVIEGFSKPVWCAPERWKFEVIDQK